MPFDEMQFQLLPIMGKSGMYRTRHGEANPERVENALWEQAIHKGWTAWQLRQHIDAQIDIEGHISNPSHSTYQNSKPGPFWSWKRSGRTSTQLDDGRVVHVGGEHEDFYDEDFCIYNDVVVEHPAARFEFYLYPVSVFPPTDFHTATLINGKIILIGSTGYKDMRHLGTTQVLALDISTFKISRLDTKGDGPGWISRHSSELRSESVIIVRGGIFLTKQGRFEPNTHSFQLNMEQLVWSRLLE